MKCIRSNLITDGGILVLLAMNNGLYDERMGVFLMRFESDESG